MDCLEKELLKVETKSDKKIRLNRTKMNEEKRIKIDLSQRTVDKTCENLNTSYEKFYKGGNHVIRNNLHTMEFILTPEQKCANETVLFIFVASYFNNTLRRENARITWAQKDFKLKNFEITKYQVVFVLGKAPTRDLNVRIERESKVYGDILQIDQLDIYENLVYKSLLGLRYAKDFCSSARYIMKLDDDILVNIPLLSKYIRKMTYLSQNKQYIFGYCYSSAQVIRFNTKTPEFSDKNKMRNYDLWRVPCKDYPFEYYPEYTAGHGYIISAPLAKDLYSVSQTSPLLIVEDAFLTGVLRTKSNMPSKLLCSRSFSTAGEPRPNDMYFDRKSFTYEVTIDDALEKWSYLLNRTLSGFEGILRSRQQAKYRRRN